MTQLNQQLRAPRHPKYDAIHRALLTGLLSNIGNKGEGHEYIGPRGVRFNIFPGSGQFEQKPKWVMAAELVETTRLYARICAGVQPQWIERIAAHLVERTYSDPHWDARTQSVLAFERVTLYGMVLAARRIAAYGPVNPKISRDLFIHHALVLEELRTDAPFFQHNRALVEEVRGLEAKVRAHNLLADAATRFAFYDARVPKKVTNGAQFEAWRRRAEKDSAEAGRFLHMNKEDLLRADAPEITPVNYPDRTEVFGMNLPLNYSYAPGEANDGITLAVPLAALQQIRPQRYEWLVPGMLEEKVAALIKSLPGTMRRNFVPVSEFARAAIAGMGNVEDISLLEALAKHLSRMTGAAVSAADFKPETLPEYLKMSFRVVDDGGRTAAISRDLPALQRKLAKEASHAFSKLPGQSLQREHVTDWDFGDLPEVVQVQRFNMSIDAYPALEIQPDGSIALKLFPHGPAALHSHRAGLRRLFLLKQARELKAMLAYVNGLDQMTLLYRSMGTGKQMRDYLAELIIDRTLIGDRPQIRTLTEWTERRQIAVAALLEVGDKVTSLIGDILQLIHQISLRIDDAGNAWPMSLVDIHDQLTYLLPSNFMLATPWQWLTELPRYLRGILSRIDKLNNGNYKRDAGHTQDISPLWSAYVARADQHRAVGLEDPELALYRWMLEEYRIHLFAQELPHAVSNFGKAA